MLQFERDVRPWLQVALSGDRSPGTATHQFYRKSILHKTEVRQVFGDEYPKYLDRDRPRETPEQKKYRKSIYENVYRSFPSRVEGAMNYIREADDFDVVFPTTDLEGEDTLQNYTGESMTTDGSLTDWFFKNVLSENNFDPNAVLLTLPDDTVLDQRAYPRPIPRLIPCENVLAFKKGKFAVLISEEKTKLPTDSPGKKTGLVLYIVDHESYTICRQTAAASVVQGTANNAWMILGASMLLDEQSQPSMFWDFPLHYCLTLPARKVGSKRKEHKDGEEFYESFLTDALPHIRLGQRAQSDLQVEINFHVSAQEWRRVQGDCKNKACKGGIVYDIAPDGPQAGAILGASKCPICDGTGYDVTGSGLHIHFVKEHLTDNLNRQDGKSAPGAPGGFIPRDIAPLQELVKEFERCTAEAYTTINMQFVRSTPLVQSGKAKFYDREEMYRILNTLAAHFCDLLQFAYYCVDCQRYGPVGRQGEQLPQVLVPVRFAIENSEMIREELNNAKSNKYDSTIIEALETKDLLYIVGENSDEFQRYRLRKRLDPYRDMSDEMKAYTLGIYLRNQESEEQKRAIARILFSIHFDGLVSDALLADGDFWTLTLEQQKTKLVELNTQLVGPFTVGTDATGKMPKLEPLQLTPPVNTQLADQILQEEKP